MPRVVSISPWRTAANHNVLAVTIICLVAHTDPWPHYSWGQRCEHWALISGWRSPFFRVLFCKATWKKTKTHTIRRRGTWLIKERSRGANPIQLHTKHSVMLNYSVTLYLEDLESPVTVVAERSERVKSHPIVWSYTFTQTSHYLLSFLSSFKESNAPTQDVWRKS